MLDQPNLSPVLNRRFNNLTLLVYIIQAIGLFTAFPGVIGLIINYLKLNDVRGTMYESHFRWQIRTFWWSLLWVIIGAALSLILVGYLVLLINWCWVAYRIIKGFLNLNDGVGMPW